MELDAGGEEAFRNIFGLRNQIQYSGLSDKPVDKFSLVEGLVALNSSNNGK